MASTAAPAKQQPNIVLFVLDDLGWNDVGYHGSEIATPRIDAMAKNGVELDSFYAFSWCITGRVGLETGINPAKFGIRSLQKNYSDNTAIPRNTETIADVLQAAGYETAMLGKWHLSENFKGGPLDKGYDYAFGYFAGQIDHFEHTDHFGRQTLFRNREFVKEEGHFTDVVTKEAVAAISRARAPFFLTVRYSAPHYPLQATQDYIDRYQHLSSEQRRIYAAMVTHVDDSIGTIIDTVGAQNLLEDTIFIFLSDNGGQQVWRNSGKFYEGKFGPYTDMASNDPLKGFKTGAYEGGIRVPAIVYAPGRFRPRKVTEFASVLDLLPTIMSWAGIENTLNLDGRNIQPLLEGGGSDGKTVEFYWLTSSVNIPNGGGPQGAVRIGDWKLVTSKIRYSWLPHRLGLTYDRHELFNLAEDPGETKNLYDSKPDLAEELLRKLTAYSDANFHIIKER